MKKTRVLTGIKPTGDIHLGNYVGAIRPCIEFSQDPAHEVILMCADWHGLTTRNEIMDAGKATLPLLSTFLTLGFKTEGNSLVLQSDFPQIQENAWYLGCVTGTGLLDRAHAYKDAIASGQKPTAGLYFYPVLMASDIVTFDTELVPVGKDQAQHLEYMSDMTKLFNNSVNSEAFKEAKPLIREEAALLVGTDGERKMSKSYNNSIPLFGNKKEIEKRIKEIKTDSKGLDDVKDPDTCAVYQILKSFGSEAALNDMAEKLRKGKGYGYGHAKMDLWAEHQRVFGSKQAEFEHYVKNPKEIWAKMEGGYARATSYADGVVKRVRSSLGLVKLKP